ncbi:MAG: biotin transporter BioY [Pseudanabaenaceae cyanobacterium]
MSWSLQVLWAVSGLILTVIATFWQTALLIPTSWHDFALQPLPTTWQVGAVLFIGCVGGKWAAVLSQGGYILLGLLGLNVFYQGGGWGYLGSPAFGYLLGFAVGGAVCGHLAFARDRTLENLLFSCVAGLVMIHFVGISWLILRWFPDFDGIVNLIQQYSVAVFGGQLLTCCAIPVLAGIFRFFLLY